MDPHARILDALAERMRVIIWQERSSGVNYVLETILIGYCGRYAQDGRFRRVLNQRLLEWMEMQENNNR